MLVSTDAGVLDRMTYRVSPTSLQLMGVFYPVIQGVRAGIPTRLETRTKESNVHASHPAFMLVGEAHAKSIKGSPDPRSALLTGL